MTCKRERAHRIQGNHPYLAPPAPSRIRAITTIDSSDDSEHESLSSNLASADRNAGTSEQGAHSPGLSVGVLPGLVGIHAPPGSVVDVELPGHEDDPQTMLWRISDEFSDEEPPHDDDVQGMEDSDDESREFSQIDWANFEIGDDGNLSAWDQLGAGYDKEFANIRELDSYVYLIAINIRS